MALEFPGTGFTLRQATAADHDALRMVCLKTGNNGDDATGIEDDPDLIGMVYAVPYQIREPDFAWILKDAEGPAGYVLGAPDTLDFHRYYAGEWLPSLCPGRADPGPDEAVWSGSDWLRRMIHHPPGLPPVDLDLYPAHLHIDLMPRAQGKGLGRAALTHLMRDLAAAGAPGVHLVVGARNTRAHAFYRALGFATLYVSDDDMGMALDLAGI